MHPESNTRHRRRRGCLGLCLATALGGGCDTKEMPTGVGQVSLALQLNDGLQVDSLHYVLTAVGQPSLSGDLDVRNTTRPSALLAGVPASQNYHLVLSATTTNGAVACKANGTFDLAAGATAALDLVLLCDPADAAGTTSYLCSSFGDRWSSASNVLVGGQIDFALALMAGTSGRAPSLSWTVTPSELGNVQPGGDAGARPDGGTASFANATLLCGQQGSGTVTVSLTDSACASQSVSFPVSCLGAGADGGVAPGQKLNVCPSISWYSADADPGHLLKGVALGLNAEASDRNGEPLTFKWTAGSPSIGQLTKGTGAAASFVCTATGETTLSVSVSDGRCADSRDPAFYVSCVAP